MILSISLMLSAIRCAERRSVAADRRAWSPRAVFDRPFECVSLSYPLSGLPCFHSERGPSERPGVARTAVSLVVRGGVEPLCRRASGAVTTFHRQATPSDRRAERRAVDDRWLCQCALRACHRCFLSELSQSLDGSSLRRHSKLRRRRRQTAGPRQSRSGLSVTPLTTVTGRDCCGHMRRSEKHEARDTASLLRAPGPASAIFFFECAIVPADEESAGIDGFVRNQAAAWTER